jgi:hypothetical protein
MEIKVELRRLSAISERRLNISLADRLCLLLRSISGIKISIYCPENEWRQFLPMDIFNSPTTGLE